MADVLDFTEKQTILAVDDTPEMLQVIHGLLMDDYRVQVANSGDGALRIALTPPVPDLILLDVSMPEMDGYEVCKRLKNNQITAHIPVIFLTARTDLEDEEKGFDAGAVDYITKPISPSLLKARAHALNTEGRTRLSQGAGHVHGGGAGAPVEI